MATALPDKELDLIDAYWRAANYLSVGQIYLYDNPLLKKPLAKEHIKPRLLGHWGTTPGLNFIYVHLNRRDQAARPEHDLHHRPRPRRAGPGRQRLSGGHLQRGLSEHLARTRRACSASSSNFPFPGGIPSHVAPETPGSIHEGGELGYALSHAYGAAFDNPDLIVACVVGDGEAETGPLATSWHSNKFLNPATDGAVLPILHLNGYKIANPCILARISHEELRPALPRLRLHALFRRGQRPGRDAPEDGRHARHDHRRDPAHPGGRAQERRQVERPRWPMIVLRTPKGWTGPKEVDGKRTEDYWRSHQVPMGEMHENPEHVRNSRSLDEELPARGTLRRERTAQARTRRDSPPRATAA